MANANWVEIIWTALCLVGAGALAPVVWESLDYHRWLRQSGQNGARLLAATSQVRDERKDLIELLIFAAIGLAAMLTPSQDNAPTLAGYVMLIGLLIILGQILARGKQRRAEYRGMAHYLPDPSPVIPPKEVSHDA